ncbi:MULTISPECIES: hypothetical protein [unclassified Arthrobacter]|nr:hypothetical protein [Arthrobacter sp. MAHUQ-56]
MTSGDLCPVYFLSDSTGITAETRGQHLAEQIASRSTQRPASTD